LVSGGINDFYGVAVLESVKIGIVGCGGIAGAHAPDLLKLVEEGYEIEVEFLIDTRADAAEAFKAKWGFSDAVVSTDYRDALGKVDAALILTPHALHYRQALDFLRSGAHVLVEKPMACRLEEAYSLVEEAESQGLVLEVGYQRHFEPLFRELRKQLLGGGLGNVNVVSMVLGQDWYRLSRGTWRQVKSLSCGGELIDSGSHFVDVALWATGKRPVEVFAYTNNYDCEVDIDSVVAARLDGGTLLSFTVAGNDPGWLEAEIFWCEKGRVMAIPPQLTVVRSGGEAVTLKPEEPGSRPVLNFVRSILGEEENEAPGKCGLYVAAFTEAAYVSAIEGRRVSIKELCIDKGLDYSKYFG